MLKECPRKEKGWGKNKVEHNREQAVLWVRRMGDNGRPDVDVAQDVSWQGHRILHMSVWHRVGFKDGNVRYLCG